MVRVSGSPSAPPISPPVLNIRCEATSETQLPGSPDQKAMLESVSREKTDVEGTCFVYERSAAPYNGFIILNRLGRKNFIEPLTANMEFQLQEPFLLYRNPPYIYGIWFYEVKECKTMSELFRRMVAGAKRESASKSAAANVKPRSNTAPAVSTAIQSSGPATGGVDIITLLSKAQSQYDEKQISPNHPTAAAPDTMVKPRPVRLEPASSTQAAASDNKTITIDDLFKKASLNSEQKSVSPEPSSLTTPDNTDEHYHAFKRPLPLDKMTTVTELERQHTPELTDSEQLLTPASLTATTTNKQAPSTGSTPSSKTAVVKDLGKNELMSPMAFSVGRRDVNRAAPIPVAINPPQHVNVSESVMSGFHTINQLQRSTSYSSDLVPHEPEPPIEAAAATTDVTALTKEQLKQALIHLLNNDNDFLHSIHRAYTNSLNISLRR